MGNVVSSAWRPGPAPSPASGDIQLGAMLPAGQPYSHESAPDMAQHAHPGVADTQAGRSENRVYRAARLMQFTGAVLAIFGAGVGAMGWRATRLARQLQERSEQRKAEAGGAPASLLSPEEAFARYTLCKMLEGPDFTRPIPEPGSLPDRLAAGRRLRDQPTAQGSGAQGSGAHAQAPQHPQPKPVLYDPRAPRPPYPPYRPSNDNCAQEFLTWRALAAGGALVRSGEDVASHHRALRHDALGAGIGLGATGSLFLVLGAALSKWLKGRAQRRPVVAAEPRVTVEPGPPPG